MRFINQGVCGATLILAAGGAAAADSSVTLYGVVDANIQYQSNGGVHSYSEKSGGSTGSLFGLKGSEDLGGGLRAQFNVESGFNANNGGLFADTTALFYRQAWVGLTHEQYGSLSMGRQYEPSFRVIYPSDPFRANEVLSPFSAGFVAVRLKERARSICEVLLILRARKIDQRRTDAFREHISFVLWQSCA